MMAPQSEPYSTWTGAVVCACLIGRISRCSFYRRGSARRQTVDWLGATGPLGEGMKRRGVPNLIYLPPEVEDVRPWLRRGFLVSTAYAYHLDLPFDPAMMERSQRQNGDRASRLGTTVDRVNRVDPVVESLTETAQRVRFSKVIGHRDLRWACDVLGEGSLTLCVCFDSTGGAASSAVALHVPGARAIGWLFGTKTDHLAQGAGQLLWRWVFGDLAIGGATAADFGGPNCLGIVTFKSRWGSKRATISGVRSYTLRAGARFLAEWLNPSRFSLVGPLAPDPSITPGVRPGAVVPDPSALRLSAVRSSGLVRREQ